MVTAELVLPTPGNAPLPSGWWRDHAVPYFDSVTEVDAVADDARRLAALASYVKNRQQRDELDAARIVAETRIGELLEGTAGGTSVTKQDGTRFRKLAKHRDLVWRLLNDGIGSRKRILAKIDASKLERLPISGVELRHGDFRDVLDDLDGQVDAIITDPPYEREYLPLYEDLSEVAARVLRPGGILAAMCGQVHLPEVLDALRMHLSYRWQVVYLMGGAAATMYQRRVQVQYKPILVFEKLPTDINHRIGSDVIRAGGNDRDDTEHHWGQTEHGMAQVVERLTSPGDLVLDPFAGGATTLVVCSELGRPCIGVEIDEIAAQRAQERLGAA